MEFTPITGLQIRINFYTNRGCVLEDVIENHFYNYFSLVNPLIIGMSSSGFFKKLKEIQVLTLFSYIGLYYRL